MDIVHVDVYRLDNLGEVRDLGENVFATDVVTFLEWGDAVERLLPDDRLEVEILLGDDADEREVRVRGLGTWADRRPSLAEALEPWTSREER